MVYSFFCCIGEAIAFAIGVVASGIVILAVWACKGDGVKAWVRKQRKRGIKLWQKF